MAATKAPGRAEHRPHQIREEVVKQLGVLGDPSSHVGLPAPPQAAQARRDEAFEVKVSEELVGLVHHSLSFYREEKQLIYLTSEHILFIYIYKWNAGNRKYMNWRERASFDKRQMFNKCDYST